MAVPEVPTPDASPDIGPESGRNANPASPRREQVFPATAQEECVDLEDRLRFEHERLRVLIVEDDAIVTSFLQSIVTSAGGEVAGTAASGHAAIGLAHSIRPDIVIMDIGLPGMNGIDAAAVIRAREPLPIVFISGQNVEAAVARRLGGLSGVGFLLKPFGAIELCDALLRAYVSSLAPK